MAEQPESDSLEPNEEAIRANLWARQLVWQQKEIPEVERSEPEKNEVVLSLPPIKKKEAMKQSIQHKAKAKAQRRVNPAQGVVVKRRASPQSTPSLEAEIQKVKATTQNTRIVSTLLPRRLGLGRVADVGGGEVKGRTRFAAAYKSGAIGRWLRVDQNGARPDVAFAVPVATIPLNAVLPLCFEGLRESTHPLCLLARKGAYKLLIEHPGAKTQVPTFLPSLILPLRLALASKNRDVANAAILQVAHLAKAAGPALIDHLDKILQPLARHAFGSPLAKRVHITLHEIESSVPESRPKIKAKIPSYE